MSLINDALRKKKQEKEKAADNAEGSPMQPVYTGTQNSAPMLKLILLALIVLVLGMAALLFWKGWQTKNEPVETVTASPKPAPIVPAEKVSATSPVAVPVQPAPETTVTAVDNAETILDSAAATNPVVPPAPPAPPPLKLQGIFYRPSNPTAMINGKTVGPGEMVFGARVLQIERQQVIIEREGKQETLRLD